MIIKRPSYAKIASFCLLFFLPLRAQRRHKGRKVFTVLRSCSLTVLCLTSSLALSQNLPLLPYPQQVIEREGVFKMNEFVPVFRPKKATVEEMQAIWMLSEGFENIFGKPLSVTEKEKGSLIVLRNLKTEIPPQKQEKMILPVGEEGYQLNISPDRIEIISNSNTGLFYGTQTLLQLFRISSLTGSINCVTINDMPSLSKRYLCYDWDSVHVPSFNYIKQLIQCVSHFKINGIAFFNDSLVSPFAETELFYLKKFAEPYHVDIVTRTRKLSDVQFLNINLKHKIYPEFQQTLKTIFPPFAEDEENKMTFFHNNGATLVIDNWYSIFWLAELSWNQPKANTAILMKERQTQYEKSLDKQLFETDFPLCEQLRAFDSLHIISLSEQDFLRPVTSWIKGQQQRHYEGDSPKQSSANDINPANNRFVLTRALALEERLQLILENNPIMHDEIVYSLIFACQRAAFIALKNLLQESLAQQSTEPETIQETVEILRENIRHLKQAHETLWTIENNSALPKSIAQKYDWMSSELENIEY